MSPSPVPVPDILALPLKEAENKLAQAGFEIGEVRETRGPRTEDEGLELRVARIRVTGTKVQLVVVRTQPGPVWRGAP
ncbi:MAG: hypothetical protein PWP12_27 [Bacillota bacterium]|jgi:beta-lactam-binding protein with PASTA domain|nr:hypothetical protein [Bacillota bacterium]MDK2881706.1 hypothetical protein [Bacillota bacterium]MDK2959843.1 hypothetical protein [Bacillota bacterium]